MDKDRYFNNVKDLIEYASDDIERFNSFEFQYGTIGEELYNVVRNIEGIKEIDNDTFEFNDIVFNLDLVIPCC